MGSNIEFASMLDFVEKHKIVPVVDSVYNLEDGNEAIEKMTHSPQFGKIVLKI